MKRRSALSFIYAAIVAVPGIFIRLGGLHFGPQVMAITSGIAITGVFFILLWACEAVQADISQALALAIVTLIAKLSGSAADVYFTWQVGVKPQGGYAGWPLVLL